MRLLLLTCTALLGCAAPTRLHTPAAMAPWLRSDPQRCLLVRDLSMNMEAMARHCAERFVRENGYTEDPATEDSTRWVMEVGDQGAWPEILAARMGSLQPHATAVQCSSRRCFVLFQLRRPVFACAYRMVTMTQVFTKLQLEPGGIQDVRCGERRS